MNNNKQSLQQITVELIYTLRRFDITHLERHKVLGAALGIINELILKDFKETNENDNARTYIKQLNNNVFNMLNNINNIDWDKE